MSFCKYVLDRIFVQRNQRQHSKDRTERHEYAFNSGNYHTEDSVLAFLQLSSGKKYAYSHAPP